MGDTHDTQTRKPAAACSCTWKTTSEPAPRRFRRVRRGMRWVDELEPEPPKANGCAGMEKCDACKAHDAAAYPHAAYSAIAPSNVVNLEARRVSSAATQASAKTSPVKDPAGWLEAFRARLENAKAAAKPAGDAPPLNAEGWVDESAEIARRRRELEGRDASRDTLSASDRAALDSDWNTLGMDRKREIATALAASATRDSAERLRLINVALTQGINALNRILDGEYGIVMARINANRDIELARINSRGTTERLLLTQAQQQTLANTPSNNNNNNSMGGGMMLALVAVLAVMMMGRK